MKITDDRMAKIRLWARNPRVVALPVIANLPRFRSRKFNSYQELNAWKADLLQQIASQGGIRWKK